MKKGLKKYVNYVVVFLIIIEGIFIFLSYKSFNNKEINLSDEVKLKDIVNKNNMFAIMVDDGTGKYTEKSEELSYIFYRYQ